jgi:hypothetical protein
VVKVTLQSVYPRERILVTIKREPWVGYKVGPKVSGKRKIPTRLPRREPQTVQCECPQYDTNTKIMSLMIIKNKGLMKRKIR